MPGHEFEPTSIPEPQTTDPVPGDPVYQDGAFLVDGHVVTAHDDHEHVELLQAWPEWTQAANNGTLEDESDFHPQ